MAGEVLLINPRRRGRHRRKRSRRARAARPRRRRRSLVARNPRRVVRRRRRSARRRYARNPRGLGGTFMGVNFGQALMGGAGFVGTNLLAGQLGRMIPPPADPNMANLLRIGLKAGATIGGAMLLRRSPLRGFANAWAVGGGIATVVDALSTYLLPAVGLSDYQTGELSAYQTGMLSGYDDGGGAILSGGAYGNGAY